MRLIDADALIEDLEENGGTEIRVDELIEWLRSWVEEDSDGVD